MQSKNLDQRIDDQNAQLQSLISQLYSDNFFGIPQPTLILLLVNVLLVLTIVRCLCKCSNRHRVDDNEECEEEDNHKIEKQQQQQQQQQRPPRSIIVDYMPSQTSPEYTIHPDSVPLFIIPIEKQQHFGTNQS